MSDVFLIAVAYAPNWVSNLLREQGVDTYQMADSDKALLLHNAAAQSGNYDAYELGVARSAPIEIEPDFDNLTEAEKAVWQSAAVKHGNKSNKRVNVNQIIETISDALDGIVAGMNEQPEPQGSPTTPVSNTGNPPVTEPKKSMKTVWIALGTVAGLAILGVIIKKIM